MLFVVIPMVGNNCIRATGDISLFDLEGIVVCESCTSSGAV